jgi:hypothetical protein
MFLRVRFLTRETKNKLVQAVTLMTCIREAAGSNLGRDTEHPD